MLALTHAECLERTTKIDRQPDLLGTDDPAASDGLRDERDELAANLYRALEADEERDRTRAALQEGFDRKAWMTGRGGLRFERTTPQDWTWG